MRTDAKRLFENAIGALNDTGKTMTRIAWGSANSSDEKDAAAFAQEEALIQYNDRDINVVISLSDDEPDVCEFSMRLATPCVFPVHDAETCGQLLACQQFSTFAKLSFLKSVDTASMVHIANLVQGATAAVPLDWITSDVLSSVFSDLLSTMDKLQEALS